MFSIFISIAFTIASALVDRDTLKWGYIDDHSSRFIQRVIFFIPLMYINFLGAIGGALIFTALFDQLLNKFRGMSLFYLGNTAKWDRFFNRHLPLYMSVKVFCLFIGIYLCLK